MGLLRFLFWIFIFLIAMRLIGRLFRASFHFEIVTPPGGGNRPPPPGGAPGSVAAEMARDPSCGSWIAVEGAVKINTGATMQYFCSQQCLDTYRKKLIG